MESKAVQSASRFDFVKWLVVFVLIAIGVVGNQYYSAESLLYRVLALVGLAIVAALVALQTDRGRRFATLLKEARVEIRKGGMAHQARARADDSDCCGVCARCGSVVVGYGFADQLAGRRVYRLTGVGNG